MRIRPEGGKSRALAQLMVVLDVAIVNVALPSTQRAFNSCSLDGPPVRSVTFSRNVTFRSHAPSDDVCSNLSP
jgi:hypothetical protein